MSGGSGTRLWPLSTDAHPKQFHALGAGRSMIEETALRLVGQHGDIAFLAPVVIAGERHRDLVETSLAASGIAASAVVLEPEGRDTAATAALAAMVGKEIAPGALVLLMPADHIVADPLSFVAAITRAAPIAGDRIVTFGMDTGGKPETGYGYIKQGEALAPGVHAVIRFTEKPGEPEARGYIAEGGYTWNSGVFFFAPDVMLEEFSHASADIRDGAKAALARARRAGNEIVVDAGLFGQVRKKPVDKAVMEHTRRAAVVPCDIGWADIGSWAELWRLSPQDEAKNASVGSVSVFGGRNNLIRAEGVHVSVVDVSDLVIVATQHAVLIMPRERAQDVKKFIPPKK